MGDDSASDSLRAIRRRGGNVLDLRETLQGQLGRTCISATCNALPKVGPWGYNDAAAVSLALLAMIRPRRPTLYLA